MLTAEQFNHYRNTLETPPNEPERQTKSQEKRVKCEKHAPLNKPFIHCQDESERALALAVFDDVRKYKESLYRLDTERLKRISDLKDDMLQLAFSELDYEKQFYKALEMILLYSDDKVFYEHMNRALFNREHGIAEVINDVLGL